MSDGTLVECLECGHEWETVAEYPQCSDPEDICGRSRNVEPVNDTNAEGGPPSERDTSPSGDSQTEGEWSPLFDAENTDTEPVEDMSLSEKPELEDHPELSDDDGESPEFEQGPELPDLEPEDIELFVKTPFDMAAKSRGEHWELGDDELSQLSHAYAKVGNKYAPYLMAEHAPEVMATITTVAVIGPRVATDRQEAKEEEKGQTDDEPKESGDRRNARPAEAVAQTQESFAYDNV